MQDVLFLSDLSSTTNSKLKFLKWPIACVSKDSRVPVTQSPLLSALYTSYISRSPMINKSLQYLLCVRCCSSVMSWWEMSSHTKNNVYALKHKTFCGRTHHSTCTCLWFSEECGRYFLRCSYTASAEFLILMPFLQNMISSWVLYLFTCLANRNSTLFCLLASIYLMWSLNYMFFHLEVLLSSNILWFHKMFLDI